MSQQQPPEWWSKQQGPRFGCADVTIVAIASIAAFVILIFVLLRPDFARVVDVTGGSTKVTISAIRPTETASPARATSSLVAPTPTATAIPVPPTATPAPALRKANLLDSCRLRQDAGYEAQVIQVFNKGVAFKIYTESKVIGRDTWIKAEPDDGTSRQGWILASCFPT